MKESIGFDLDGVLYPFVKSLCTYYRMYEGYTGTDLNFYQNIDKIAESKIEYLVTLEPLYSSCVPANKLVALLRNLGEKFNVCYITARPTITRLTTEKYLSNYKFPQHTNLFFTPNKDTLSRLLKLDYFVEDNVKNAEKISKVCMCFLVKTPYNEHYAGEVPMLNSIYDLERILL